ncbi:hypothetical protein HA402_007537 [Bradysia odoriphaga]|nr:hypothetical protein HA402_007537 [Bradysia odoriphaga]
MKYFNILTSARNVWKCFIYSLFLSKFVKSDKDVPGKNEQLPYCGSDTDNPRDTSRRLLFVSTLDGRLSALDMGNGTLEWSIPTKPGPMLSSSIHNYEMGQNFQSVRMIPSLNGNLYKFDGEDIEQLPITAEDLLQSSFQFPDELVSNLVISGGKETRSYGVSTRNGRVMYECSVEGCKDTIDYGNELDRYNGPYKIGHEQHDPQLDDIIVVRRDTQTVRAFEPISGGERWNFSVGTHQLELLKSGDCHNRPYSDRDQVLLDLELKVIVPEGIVCAVHKHTPNTVLWQYKFSHPIVNAWKNSNDDLVKLDLFSYNHLPFGINTMDGLAPAVYVAMYEKQLYIQESDEVKPFAEMKKLKYLESQVKIPWKPFSITSSEFAMIEGTIQSEDQDETDVTALSVLQGSEYVNGNGYYLFSHVKPKRPMICDSNATKSIDDGEQANALPVPVDDDTPAMLMVSLWFWWKEILVISLTTALLLNVMLSRRLSSEREVVIVERHVEIKVPVTPDVPDDEILTRRSISESTNNDNFVSRFQDDFDMVQCLGKGGFGVVFEVKNKLDDCKYAIKRIVLPNRQESRDRVMREVKTLAHCEHHNIVRYFQAWVETPPPGWQEKEDKIWMDREALSHSIDIDSPSELSPPAFPVADSKSKVFSEVINQKNKGLDSWISNLNTNECINFDDFNRKTSFNVTTDNDDSFIQFRDYTNSKVSDSVFKSNDKSEARSIDDSSGVAEVDDSSDSFEIEFKEPTISNGCNGHSSTNDDSFRIEFRNPSISGRKQRTYSVNDECLNGLFKESTGNCNAKSIDSVDSATSNNKVVPLRKTHRRPMSLDLSSRRSVQFLHPNRVYLYIQMQLCKKQSLKDWLKLNSLDVRQQQIVPIFKQIVEGVEYCHLKGLIHRDLKPSNIFFSLDGQIKIGDFGLVTDMSDIPNSPCGDINGSFLTRVKHTEQVGTHLYMSPEQIEGRQYNYKVDIYSLGLIFFELLVVFCTEMERIETLKSLRMSRFPPDFHSSFPDEYKLLKLMLSQSPLERPTTIGIRSHAPLSENTSTEWHFDLPPRRRDSHVSSGLSSHSSSDIPTSQSKQSM